MNFARLCSLPYFIHMDEMVIKVGFDGSAVEEEKES
jgi:hypothetical protein